MLSAGREAAARILELAGSRPPTLGTGRLVCLDGPAGSGKTTLATRIAARAPGCAVVHLDDLYDGWDGLSRVGEQLDTLLRPLARTEAGCYRRYDWAAGGFAETVSVPPTPLLVLEGVGAGSATHAALATVTVWVRAPADLRRARALARDGASFGARWDAWAAAEATCFEASGVAGRADLTVEWPDPAPGVGSGGAVVRPSVP